MKKFIKLFIVLLFSLCFFSNCVFASIDSTTTFSVVDETKCIINFGENGNFEKKIISYDEKSATLQLDVTNNANDSTSITNSEIILVLDNSLSLRDQVNDTTRKELIYSSAKTLVEKLFQADPNFKIGVVSFSSNLNDEGTLSDASLKQTLTSDSTVVLNAIEAISNGTLGYRTDIEAGLELANQNFSGTADKEYVILITDGIPNVDLHGHINEYSTEVADSTKNKLLELKNNGKNIITVLTGVSNRQADLSEYTYQELATYIFGSPLVPTAGKYYNISDSEIQSIIENDVFNDIQVIPGIELTNIVIKDYFPQEIIDNFDFEYVSDPNIGTVTASVDTSTNCITWTIPSLKSGQTASLKYKLTLKDNYSTEILDKILPTNEKVDITDDQGDNVSSTDSPKVKVTATTPVTQEPESSSPDTTIIPSTQLPQTGTNTYLILFIAVIISTFGIYTFIKYKRH
jgi:LPXTG-motif cell wall-anchored protein